MRVRVPPGQQTTRIRNRCENRSQSRLEVRAKGEPKIIKNQTTLTKALQLAKLGLHVFPLRAKHQPLTEHGHLDSSTDPERIATWFSEYPDALIGVHTGASGIVVLDIDKKDARDGFETIEAQWLTVPDTYAYDTMNNGVHMIYAAPDDVTLNGQKDYRHWTGIDRKGGSSYIVWWGSDVPDSRDMFNEAPDWLCDPAKNRVGAAFEGGLDAYLGNLEPGEPTDKVLDAIGRISDEPFGHDVLIASQYNLVRLGAEGHTGVRDALELLRDAWLRPPWNSQDYSFEFDLGLSGAIAKAGAEDSEISSLPDYMEVFNLLSLKDAERLLIGAKPKSHYFKVITELVSGTLTDPQIASLVWHAPSTKPYARDWGISYLYEQITVARNAPVVPVEALERQQEVDVHGISLLSAEERLQADQYETFVDQYVDLARTRYTLLNAPYHRMAAWTILSLGFGGVVFIPVNQNIKMGCNLFMLGLGESSSGKSQSLALRNDVLKEFFTGDEEFNLGSNMSLEYLQEKLITRDGLASFFEADEAALVFKQMMDPKAYNAGLDTFLTKVYEGHVPPVGKKSAKDISGKSALTSFTIAMMGTPEKVLDLVTEANFEDGSLARYIWTYGDSVLEVSGEETESQAEHHVAVAEFDAASRALAVELYEARRFLGGGRKPMLATDEAIKRIGRNRDLMKSAVKGSQRQKILAPSIKRLGDNVRKAATLLALVSGSEVVEMHHVLLAIKEGERWLRDLVVTSEGVVASKFQRDVDEVERYIMSQGGAVGAGRLYAAFKRYEPKEMSNFLLALENQERVLANRSLTAYSVVKDEPKEE